MTLHVFNRAQLPAVPWKNGGGVTREIVASPRGAGLDAFAWRVSIADVSTDGPFSVFEGVDRVLMLLEGNGVALRGGDGRIVRRLDEPFVPFAFPGDARITSSLLAGPSVDFNVMTRRALARADVRIVRASEALDAFESGVLFAARGRWVVRLSDGDSGDRAIGAAFRFNAGDGCWWDEACGAWRVAPESSDAILIAVGIRRASV
jgi:environmental stress-induced protein Ves